MRLKNQLFSIEEVRLCLAELSQALRFLHKMRICHRDVKPDNILIDSDGHIVLSDFGLAVHIEDAEVLYTKCGTRAYMAPGTFSYFFSLVSVDQGKERCLLQKYYLVSATA